ncbi:MAG: hypothetical protein Aureis2KO_26100 [Aureisphaera sp.]
MKKTLQIANGLAFGSTIFINYLSNTGVMNGETIGSISDGLNSLFTPAGYAFAIWGLIYLLLLGFAIYQGRSLFIRVENDDFVLKIGFWFLISCVANCCWVFTWMYGYTGLSIIAMFLLLVSLLKIILHNDMELWDAPLRTILFLWWPFVIYAGWITVASIANVSAYLVKINWSGWGISPTLWTVFMIGIATSVNTILIWKRNLREFAAVGVWALFAIAVANWDAEQAVKTTALIAAVFLSVNIVIHAAKNYKTNPIVKLVRNNKK